MIWSVLLFIIFGRMWNHESLRNWLITILFWVWCKMLGLLDHLWTPIVRVSPLKTPLRLLIRFIYNFTSRNCSHL
jgi:hypothetical protein